MVSFSLIIPVHNAEATLPRVLPSLDSLSEDWEILVIDDRSSHSPLELVSELLPSATVYGSERSKGAAGARNYGASIAQGQYFCFLDSDVVVDAATLDSMMRQLQNGSYDGIFGCYSADAPAENSHLSHFRNLLHRVVHHRCAGEVTSFWTGLGGLSREAFKAVGGFDEELSDKASIEDVELGARVTKSGYKILLDPQFQGMHLKNWTWESMIRTDIWLRAAPWTELIWRGRVDAQTMNGGWNFRLPPLLALAFLCSLPIHTSLASCFAILYLASISGLWLKMANEGGMRVGMIALPGFFVHHLCCCLGAAIGGLRFLRSKK